MVYCVAIITNHKLPILERLNEASVNIMFFRHRQVFLLCLMVITSKSGGKTQNSSHRQDNMLNPQAGQNFVVNNNCGLAKAEREMMVHIKAKVDYIAAQSGKGSPCPAGWVLYAKSCYLIIDVPTLEWDAARRNCLKLGGDLAKITSAAENQFIFNLILKQKKVTSLGAWLGLRRKADTKFYWTDDTLLSGYSAWYTGEPNHATEKCGHIYASGSGKGKWNDMVCSLSVDKLHITIAPVILCQRKSN